MKLKIALIVVLFGWMVAFQARGDTPLEDFQLKTFSIKPTAPCISSATATPLGPTTFCDGDSMDIQAAADDGTGPFTYYWNPGGETTQTVTVTIAGTYSCDVTDNDGTCGNTIATNPVAVTVNSSPSPEISITNPTMRWFTNNSIHDEDPRIHNGQIVWRASDGSDREIFFWDGSNKVQITNNSVTDWVPDIHNGQLTWMNDEDGDFEIYFWDGVSITQLSNNSLDDRLPKISNGQVTWIGHDGNDYEIFFWDGVSTTQITNNSFDDDSVEIDNGKIAWRGNGEIFFWNGVSTTQLSSATFFNRDPEIHNGQVVWSGFGGSSEEILFWDGVSTTTITTDSFEDRNPHIHNGQVVWQGFDGNDEEIFFWDGTSTTQITNNSFAEANPKIHNGQVTWQTFAGNGGIYFWDGTSTTQISDNPTNNYNPYIHNGRVTWYGYDGSDYEVFLWPSYEICNGGTVELTADVESGLAPYSYLWSPGGETTQTVTVTAAGSYSVAVTDDNVCTDISAPLLLTARTGPNVNVVPSACDCGLVTLTATASQIIEPFSYLWSPGGETTQTLLVSPDGVTSYSVTVTEAAGCQGTSPPFIPPSCSAGEPSNAELGEFPLILWDAVDWFLCEDQTDATGYNIYEGTLGSWYAPTQVSCHQVGTDFAGVIELHHTMPSASRWYVVSGSNANGESSMGRDSAGTERDDGTAPWRCGSLAAADYSGTYQVGFEDSGSCWAGLYGDMEAVQDPCGNFQLIIDCFGTLTIWSGWIDPSGDFSVENNDYGGVWEITGNMGTLTGLSVYSAGICSSGWGSAFYQVGSPFCTFF